MCLDESKIKKIRYSKDGSVATVPGQEPTNWLVPCNVNATNCSLLSLFMDGYYPIFSDTWWMMMMIVRVIHLLFFPLLLGVSQDNSNLEHACTHTQSFRKPSLTPPCTGYVGCPHLLHCVPDHITALYYDYLWTWLTPWLDCKLLRDGAPAWYCGLPIT